MSAVALAQKCGDAEMELWWVLFGRVTRESFLDTRRKAGWSPLAASLSVQSSLAQGLSRVCPLCGGGGGSGDYDGGVCLLCCVSRGSGHIKTARGACLPASSMGLLRGGNVVEQKTGALRTLGRLRAL